MPLSDSELRDRAAKWVARHTREQRKPATIKDSSDLPYGRVRVYRPDLRREQVINGLIAKPNTEVWISLRPDGEYAIDDVNVPDTVRTLGAAAGSAALPDNALDFAALSIRDIQFEPCRLQYSKQGGTYLHVTAFNYNGARYQPALDSSGSEEGSDDADVAAFYPTGTSEYGIIGCYYNPITRALVYFAGEHGYDLGSFAFADRDDVPAGMIPVGAVLVTEGKDITAANAPVFFSWQTFVDENGYLLTGTSVIRTISGGSLTVGSEAVVIVAAESGATDTLVTLNVAGAPRMLWLIADSGDTITIDHAADNIFVYGQADINFGDTQAIPCYFDGADIFALAPTATGDAADITYDSAAPDDWNGDTNPGNVNDALDQLADRVSTNESDIGGLAAGGISAAGWVSLGQSLTYASADDPTFTATCSGVDLTSTLSVGMKLRVSQSTGGTKYFIITAIAFSTDTTLTLYGGTDYNLENEAISSPYYSAVKSPYGFPLDPTKWTVEATSTGDSSQASPTQNTWYNLGTVSLSIPIGVWYTRWEAAIYRNKANCATQITLSTANNSESDADFTASQYETSAEMTMTQGREKVLVLAAKTSYYLNFRTTTASTTSISRVGSTAKTIIRAVCAYL